MTLKERLGESWYYMLQDEIQKSYFKKIPSILKKEREKFNIFPESENVFRAYRLASYRDVKCIIIGQD